MNAPSVPYLNSSNRSSGLLNPPLNITIHYMGGGYDGSVNWLRGADGGTSNRSSSAHFTFAKDGRRNQLVPLPGFGGPQDGVYKAWHVRNENAQSIGFEHEGSGGAGEWTEPMLVASAEVAAYCCQLYGIPVQGPPGPCGVRVDGYHGLLGHCNQAGNDHTDPGAGFPWAHYLDLIRAFLGGSPIGGNDVGDLSTTDLGKQQAAELSNANLQAANAASGVGAVNAKLDKLIAGGGTLKLSTADMDAIAVKVADLLAARMKA